jgi:hypothetical protein
MAGMPAQGYRFGSQVYVALETFLMRRARGTPLEHGGADLAANCDRLAAARERTFAGELPAAIPDPAVSRVPRGGRTSSPGNDFEAARDIARLIGRMHWRF